MNTTKIASVVGAVVIPIVAAILLPIAEDEVSTLETQAVVAQKLGTAVNPQIPALKSEQTSGMGYCITHASSTRNGVFFAFETDEPPPYYVGVYLPVHVSFGTYSLRFTVAEIKTYRKSGFIPCKVYDLGVFVAVISESYRQGLLERGIAYMWGKEDLKEAEVEEYRTKLKAGKIPYMLGLGVPSTEVGKDTEAHFEVKPDGSWQGFVPSNSLTNKFVVALPMQDGYEYVTNKYVKFPEMIQKFNVETNMTWKIKKFGLGLIATQEQLSRGTGFRMNIAEVKDAYGTTTGLDIKAMRAYSAFEDRSDLYYIRPGFSSLTVHGGLKYTTDVQGNRFFAVETNKAENIIHGTGL